MKSFLAVSFLLGVAVAQTTNTREKYTAVTCSADSACTGTWATNMKLEAKDVCCARVTVKAGSATANPNA